MRDKIKELFSAGVLYSFGNMLNSLIGFFLLPICTSFYSVEEYAIINLSLLIGTVCSTITYLGASSSMLRFYYDYDSEKQRQKMINSSMLLVIAGGVLQLILGICLGKSLSIHLFESGSYAILIILGLINASVQTINTSFFILLRCANKNVLYVVLNAVALLVSIGLMLVWLQFSSEMYIPFVSQIIGNTIVTLALWIYHKNLNIFKIDLFEIKQTLSFGIPVAFSSLIFYLLNTSDQLIMKEFGSLYDVGLYGFGAKISMIIQSLIIVPFSMIWAQLRMKYKGTEQFDEFLSTVSSYFVLLCYFAATVFIYLGRELIGVSSLNHVEYYEALDYLSLLIYAQIIFSQAQIFDFGIQLKKKTEVYVIAGGIVLILNIILNILGENYMGYISVPWVKLITYTLYFIIIYLISQRYYKVKLLRRNYVIIVFAISTVIVYHLSLINSPLWLRVVCICLILLLSCLAFVNNKEKQYLKRIIEK